MNKKNAKKLHNEDEIKIRSLSLNGKIIGSPIEREGIVFVNVELETNEYIENVPHTDLI